MNEKEQIEEQEEEVQKFELVSKVELDEGEIAKTKPLKIDGYKVEIVAEEFDKELSANDIFRDLQTVEENLCGTENLTNHASSYDYLISVGSGIITGLIDSFFVREFDISEAVSKDRVNIDEVIKKVAEKLGYKNKGGDSLAGSIKKLEDIFKVPQDNTLGEGVSKITHHLDDLAHHPSILGFIAAILAQCFRIGIFVNRNGKISIVFIKTDKKELTKALLALVSGILFWVSVIAEDVIERKIEINKDVKIPDFLKVLISIVTKAPGIVSILKIAVNWAGHFLSDADGSNATAGEGMGIPGLYLSFLKEVASLPILKDCGLSEEINKIYQNDKFDMRKELASIDQLGKQAIPIIINEAIIRGFYIITRLASEFEKHNGFQGINWKEIVCGVLPKGNRTIVRMFTISKGTFEVVDIADAAIRSKGFANMSFLLHLNFVGATSFVVTAGTDLAMGVKKYKKERAYENQKCLKLIRLYEKNAKGLSLIFRDMPETKKMSGPLFLHFDEPRYERESFKIMFIGTDNNLKLSYMVVRKENELILPLFEECKNFKITSTKFGKFATRVNRTMNTNSQEKKFILWNSLFKFSKHAKNIETLEIQNFNLLLQEIKICKPNAVIFMTGSRYDDYISDRLGGSTVFENVCKKQIVNINGKKIKLPNMSEKKFAKVSCSASGLPEHVYRVSNPKSLLFFLKKKATFEWLVALMGGSAEWKEEEKKKKSVVFLKKVFIGVFIIIILLLLFLLLRNCNLRPIEKAPVIQEVVQQNVPEEKLIIKTITLEEQKSAYFKRDSRDFENETDAEEWLDLMANKIKELLNENSNLKFEVKGYVADFPNEIDDEKLSRERADNVISGLVQRGVSKDILSPISAGKTNRWSDTDRRENRAAVVYSVEE